MKRVGRSFTALSAPESGPGGPGTQPQVQVSPQNIEVHEGDALRLYCRATGSPTPKLSWLKNGGRLPAQVRPGDPCTRARMESSRGAAAPPAATVELHHAVEMTTLTICLLFVPSPFYFV